MSNPVMSPKWLQRRLCADYMNRINGLLCWQQQAPAHVKPRIDTRIDKILKDLHWVVRDVLQLSPLTTIVVRPGKCNESPTETHIQVGDSLHCFCCGRTFTDRIRRSD